MHTVGFFLFGGPEFAISQNSTWLPRARRRGAEFQTGEMRVLGLEEVLSA